MLFGEPEAWVALLIEALLREGRGEPDAAATAARAGLEQAPATAGTVDGQPFAWLADADTRLGPLLEAVDQRPLLLGALGRLAKVTMEPPEDLRDMVWMPAHCSSRNGGDVVGLIPTRYPGTELANGDALRAVRRTEWPRRPRRLSSASASACSTTDAAEFGLHGRARGRARTGRPPDRGSPAPMADLRAQDRLQPALLDRLTDDAPDSSVEAATPA